MTEDPIHSLALLKRRLVAVRAWFDEEHEMPCDYVARTDDGRFEAIVCNVLGDELRERQIGIYQTSDAACKALDEYLRRLRLAQYRDWNDFNKPTTH